MKKEGTNDEWKQAATKNIALLASSRLKLLFTAHEEKLKKSLKFIEGSFPERMSRGSLKALPSALPSITLSQDLPCHAML